MIRGVSPKLLANAGVEVPEHVTTASLAILQNEYKPLAIYQKDKDGQNITEFSTHWLASPSIKDVLNIKAYIESIIERMNPKEQCECAYKKSVLDRKKFAIEYGELTDEGIRTASLSQLKARLRSVQATIKKIEQSGGDPKDKHAELYTKYTEECWELEQIVEEKQLSLADIQKELDAFPEGVPHDPKKLTDIEKCPHCHKQIAVAPMTIIMADETYDKICQLVLGIPLEEAGDIMPISQVKYLWAYIVTWVFSLPNNLPDVFLEQIQKSMSILQIPDQMANIIGMAETTEQKARSEISGTPTISGS